MSLNIKFDITSPILNFTLTNFRQIFWRRLNNFAGDDLKAIAFPLEWLEKGYQCLFAIIQATPWQKKVRSIYQFWQHNVIFEWRHGFLFLEEYTVSFGLIYFIETSIFQKNRKTMIQKDDGLYLVSIFLTETYSGPFQTSTMELFVKIVNG